VWKGIGVTALDTGLEEVLLFPFLPFEDEDGTNLAGNEKHYIFKELNTL
jgi:hypothetical protein